MSAGVGEDCTGTWELTMTLPGQPKMEMRGIPLAHPEFRTLQWLGFSSTADHATAFYLDNIELSTTQPDP
jgi:hypothetical protein